MGKPHIVSSLEARYAHIKGDLAACEARVETLRSLAGHLAETLKQYGSDPASIPAIRPTNKGRWFKQGRGTRAVLDVLRVAERPLTRHEIANRVLVLHGLGEPARQSVREIVRYALRRHSGTLLAVDDGDPRRWSTAR